MPRQKRHEICIGSMSWHGGGDTAAQARKAAEAEQAKCLERLFRQSFSPKLLASPDGRIVVLSVDPDGFWGYAFYSNEALPSGELARFGSTHAQWTEAEAERQLRRHLAQLAIKLDPKNAHFEDGLRYLDERDEEGRKEHIWYCRIQLGRSIAKFEGKSDAEAEAYGDAFEKKCRELEENDRLEAKDNAHV